ncbi:MAG TPA: hypothetical protein VMB21_20295 [Candidatus Limnocylindria bacterium]|jgi:hypothetical protein|nr:hypothetical protein [Candidatus Limnocylindria bacterium]
MKCFLSKVGILAVIQLTVLGILLARYEASGETNYLAAIVGKHQRLEALPAPRILLVGGSNVAFGFESNRIQAALKRPVVNMGLVAGVGVEFMLADIRQKLVSGDVVVLSLEYEHFNGATVPGRHTEAGFDPKVLEQILVFRPAGLLALGPAHIRRFVLNRGLTILGEIVQRAFAQMIHGSPRFDFARCGFNEFGDLVIHRGQPSRLVAAEIDQAHLLPGSHSDFPNPAVLGQVSEFVSYCAARGITVAYSFPPRPSGSLVRDSTVAESLAVSLQKIPGLIMLDRPLDHAYPATQFFDTANHLNEEAAAVRTAKVIASLREVLHVPSPDQPH